MSLCVMTPVIGSLNETYVRRHANDLVQEGAAVIGLRDFRQFWSPRGPLLLLPSSCDTHPTAGNTKDEDLRIVEFWRAHGVTVVLAEYLQFAVRFVSLACQEGVRIYVHAHGFDCSALLRQKSWAAKYLELNEASGIIVVSDKMRTTLERTGLRSDLIRRIPCGVDIPEPIERPDRSPAVHFLSVGRLTAKKGPVFLLDSFRRAFEKNRHMKLHVIGSGEMLDAVVQLVQAFRLDAAVKLYGNQPPAVVHAFMRQCDVLVQHSVVSPSNGDEEGLPVVVLEAMAAGLPVISTLHAGIPEAVVDRVTGHLVEERDSEGMAQRMLALAGDYATRTAMGRKGRDRAETAFTWERERRDLLEAMQIPVAAVQ